MKRGIAALAAAGALVLVAACSSPGSSEAESDAVSDDTATSAEGPTEAEDSSSDGGLVLPVTQESVAELGDVTLTVWADGGEEATMEMFIPKFEAEYPNVSVDLTLKGFDDLMSTVVPALSGDSPPDIAQGNQGYAVDGTLVEAGLIRPLDDVAEAYGWSTAYNPADFGQFSWPEGAQSFGSGTLYGLSPVTEFVGVFYNKEKLAALGLEAPQTFSEFEAALEAASAAGELPIMMGNADKYPATHVFGVIQGAFTDAQETRNWIGGEAGSTFDVPGNRTALETMRSWVESGYFPDGFNGLGADDATSKFGAGEGVFLVGGTWNAGSIGESLGDGAGFVSAPAGDSGLSVGTGSLGLGWHISSKTDVLPAAVAFVSMLLSENLSQDLANLNRIPATTAAVSAGNPLFETLVAGAERVLGDGGQTYYFDWATSSMYDVMTGALQEYLDGRITVDEFMEAVQGDWDAFQSTK